MFGISAALTIKVEISAVAAVMISFIRILICGGIRPKDEKCNGEGLFFNRNMKSEKQE
jgi:hypothetical protein